MIYNNPNKFFQQKYNLRKNTRIFRFTIDSCSYRIRVSLEYDLTTSNILSLPHFLHSLLSLRPNSASISIFNPPPLPSTRDPCSPRPQNYPRLVESLISGVEIREAESDFWWYLSGAPRGPTRFLVASVSSARFAPGEVFNEIKFRVEAGILRE